MPQARIEPTARAPEFFFQHLFCYFSLKAAKYEIQKTSTCHATLFRCLFLVNVSRFSPRVINLARNKNICCKLRKVVAKSKARVYFQQQNLDLSLGFHEIRNLSRDKSAHTHILLASTNLNVHARVRARVQPK